jgi:hypothetical protein
MSLEPRKLIPEGVEPGREAITLLRELEVDLDFNQRLEHEPGRSSLTIGIAFW